MATRFITVSVEIMRDTKLNQSQKFLMAEIEQLTTLEKGCIASNLHFSNLIGITKENVSRNINDLVKKGYIYVEIVAGSRNHTRIITLTTLVRPPYHNSKTPLLKQQETKENKTINKTINKKPFDLFIDYLKKNASIKSKVTTTKETKKLFEAIENKNQLVKDYLLHQKDKKEFSQRLTPFLLDYMPISKTVAKGNEFLKGHVIG